MSWFKSDRHDITVAGVNPHSVASEMGEENSPFYDEVAKPSVGQSIRIGNDLVGGTVEVFTYEHLTPAQERYLRQHPNVIDVRHYSGE